MIINSLGFISRTLSLTPNFFENKAMEVLFGENVNGDHFNRHRHVIFDDAVLDKTGSD